MTGCLSAPVNTLVSVLSASPEGFADIANTALITGITTDTRSVTAGDVFVALEGERFNGHDFAAAAIEKGAIAAIVRRGAIPETATFPRLEVDDTLAAYQALGNGGGSSVRFP